MSDLDFAHRQAENPPMFKKILDFQAKLNKTPWDWGHQQNKRNA